MSVRRFEPAIQRLQRAVVHASKPARPPAADPQRLNQGRALDRHPRGRSGRGADGDVGEAGGRVARLGPVAETVRGLGHGNIESEGFLSTFHFVTEGIHAALDRARAAAGGMDVRVGGGVATIKQYLRAGLVNGLHLALAPVLLGSGESLFPGINMRSLGYQCVEHVATDKATHVVLRRI